MFLLPRARAQNSSSGLPLKTVWKSLKAATVQIRRGGITIIGAGPGVGKSAAALILAIKSGAKGIYLSADSDATTQYSRAISILTGEALNDVQEKMARGSVAEYDKVLDQINRIWWDFNAGPTLDDIENAVDCYCLIEGRYPEFVIVDNLMNCVDESGSDGQAGLENIMSFLHELARETKSAVIVLAHLVGEYENGDTSPPLGALRGKVSKLAELVLNLFRITSDEEGSYVPERMGWAVVKNRGGQANGAGKMVVEMDMDLAFMTIKDIEVNDSGDIWQAA